ncbi:tetratricopeptide repeat protein [Gammaproteobacteria bacterium]|nr:tetratricopeptide repeat protein [Gammaproteobacteria bacterium]
MDSCPTAVFIDSVNINKFSRLVLLIGFGWLAFGVNDGWSSIQRPDTGKTIDPTEWSRPSKNLVRKGSEDHLRSKIDIKNSYLAAQNSSDPDPDSVIVGSGEGSTHRVEAVTVETVVSGAETLATHEEQQSLQRAVKHIDEQQYDQATRVLIVLLRSNPHSAIADEAWFWLGEARYLLGAFSEAVEAFETLLLYFVDSRLVPNAKLKLGLTQIELRQFEAARTTLNELLSEKVDDQIKLTAQKALGRVDAAGF